MSKKAVTIHSKHPVTGKKVKTIVWGGDAQLSTKKLKKVLHSIIWGS